MKLTTRSIALTSLFAALTALGAFLSIPVGPVSITLQTFFVLLAGILLGPRPGALSQIVYLALGLFGLPIFSGFTGGASAVFKPSFGFLIGFVAAAYIVGLLVEKYVKQPSANAPVSRKANNTLSFSKIFLIALLGTVIIYLFGLPYMYLMLTKIMHTDITFAKAFQVGCLVFLPGDLLKTLLASLLGVKILPKLNSR